MSVYSEMIHGDMKFLKEGDFVSTRIRRLRYLIDFTNICKKIISKYQEEVITNQEDSENNEPRNYREDFYLKIDLIERERKWQVQVIDFIL